MRLQHKSASRVYGIVSAMDVLLSTKGKKQAKLLDNRPARTWMALNISRQRSQYRSVDKKEGRLHIFVHL